MDKANISRETPIIFLAMFWAGGGPYSIWQILHAYDWINRGIPNREELETALNTLLALNFIEMKEGKFLVTRKIGMDFDEFRKKKRIGKFKAIRSYFEQFDMPANIPRSVELTDKVYKAELKRYREFMNS